MSGIEDDLLNLRVMLCFLESAPGDATVTGISRTLKEEKYKISRVLIALEKEGLVDRSDIRNPRLTEKGQASAMRLRTRVQISLNHLLYEGVDSESAGHDSYIWSLYCTDDTMNVIRESEERCRVKYAIREQKNFSGAELCRKLKNGRYSFPFLIYREQMKDGKILSMANEGFEHPCVLNVEDGIGEVQLRAIPMGAKSRMTGDFMKGKVTNLQYFESGRFVSAESKGQVYSIPAGVLSFVNIGTGIGQILHGTVGLQMDCSVGIIHMPTSKAMFTMLI